MTFKISLDTPAALSERAGLFSPRKIKRHASSRVAILTVFTLVGAEAYGEVSVGNTITAGDITHTFDADPFFGGTANDFLVGQNFGATPVEFTADLGTSSVFTYTLSAPEGMAFTINPASNGTTNLQSYLRWTTGFYVNPTPAVSVFLSFGGLSGTAPTLNSNGASITAPGGQVIAMQVYSNPITSSISFTSLSISLTYSGVSSASRSYTLFDGNLSLTSSDLMSDPGQLITISAVPEPSAFALGLGVATLIGVALRRPRR